MESNERTTGFAPVRRNVCRAALGALFLLPGCVSPGGWPSPTEPDAPKERELSIKNRSKEQVTASIRITSSAASSDDWAVSQTVTLGAGESQIVATVHEIAMYTVQVSVESGPEESFQWPVCTGYGNAEVLIEATSGGYSQTFIQAHSDPESSQCEI